MTKGEIHGNIQYDPKVTEKNEDYLNDEIVDLLTGSYEESARPKTNTGQVDILILDGDSTESLKSENLSVTYFENGENNDRFNDYGQLLDSYKVRKNNRRNEIMNATPEDNLDADKSGSDRIDRDKFNNDTVRYEEAEQKGIKPVQREDSKTPGGQTEVTDPLNDGEKRDNSTAKRGNTYEINKNDRDGQEGSSAGTDATNPQITAGQESKSNSASFSVNISNNEVKTLDEVVAESDRPKNKDTENKLKLDRTDSSINDENELSVDFPGITDSNLYATETLLKLNGSEEYGTSRRENTNEADINYNANRFSGDSSTSMKTSDFDKNDNSNSVAVGDSSEDGYDEMKSTDNRTATLGLKNESNIDTHNREEDKFLAVDRNKNLNSLEIRNEVSNSENIGNNNNNIELVGDEVNKKESELRRSRNNFYETDLDSDDDVVYGSGEPGSKSTPGEANPGSAERIDPSSRAEIRTSTNGRSVRDITLSDGDLRQKNVKNKNNDEIQRDNFNGRDNDRIDTNRDKTISNLIVSDRTRPFDEQGNGTDVGDSSRRETNDLSELESGTSSESGHRIEEAPQVKDGDEIQYRTDHENPDSNGKDDNLINSTQKQSDIDDGRMREISEKVSDINPPEQTVDDRNINIVNDKITGVEEKSSDYLKDSNNSVEIQQSNTMSFENENEDLNAEKTAVPLNDERSESFEYVSKANEPTDGSSSSRERSEREASRPPIDENFNENSSENLRIDDSSDNPDFASEEIIVRKNIGESNGENNYLENLVGNDETKTDSPLIDRNIELENTEQNVSGYLSKIVYNRRAQSDIGNSSTDFSSPNSPAYSVSICIFILIIVLILIILK